MNREIEVRVGDVRFLVYRAATRQFKWLWNDYPSGRIGVGLHVGRRVFSFVWRKA